MCGEKLPKIAKKHDIYEFFKFGGSSTEITAKFSMREWTAAWQISP